ncbi:MAG: N-acetylglucosamine-6-phosphate deacetylase [Verrucomicrobiota bacterium]|nr:N-acetylglucosamine-6-phosphate deacetylase [Verrucomicrobiota bacterium]
MIFTNGRVILAGTMRDDLDVEIRDGKIVALSPRRAHADAIDLRGDFLAPGFVDLHVHGALGRDVMTADAEALRAICEFHARGGTTSLLLTTVTAPLPQIVSAIDAITKARPQFPQIAGVHVEGPFLSLKKAGAQNPAFICEPTPELLEPLLARCAIIKRITLAPEINGALDAIEKFARARISVSAGHSNAWDDEVMAAINRGLSSTTHTFNCMSRARRRGIHRIAGLLECALAEPRINCELIADGYHVSPTLMRMLYRAKGAAGISLVTDATAGTGLSEGSSFDLGGKRCVVADGVGLLEDRSALAGSTATMIQLVRTMVRDVGVPLVEAIAMASRNPVRQIGLTDKGEIAPGKDADLVVLSPELEVRRTIVTGVVVGTVIPSEVEGSRRS